MATTRSPFAARLALAALSAVAAAGLVRVFAGRSWLVPVLAAALLPHLLSRLAANRGLPVWLSGPATVAAGVLFGMVVLAPTTTFFWLPTGATVRHFASAFADAPTILRSAVTPVTPREGALLLAVAAVWVTAMAADLWAERLGGTLAAVAPSLVLFVALTALGEGSYSAVTAGYAAVVATYLLCARQAELAERRAVFHGPRRRRSRVLLGGVIATVGVTAGGLVVGPLLPGARSEALFDYRDLGDKDGDGTWRTVTPMVEIRGRLVQNPPVELFTVRTARENEYRWRLVALDHFDGEIWGLEGKAPKAGNRLPEPDDLRTDNIVVRQEYAVSRLSSRWVPAAYRPVATDLDGALVIPESLTLVTPEEMREDVHYTVVSEVMAPSEALLQSAPPATGDAFDRYLELPDGFPGQVSDLAAAVTAGGATPYAKARALQDWLRQDGGFGYDLEVPAGHSNDALVDFLFEVKRGFCEQFAGAFAAMARAVGLPARVAVGFLPGTYDARAGVWRVTTLNAHAWPEVYLQGIGWVAFEPTPGRYDHTPGDPTGTGAQDPGRPTAPTTATTAPGTSSSLPTSSSTPRRPLRDEPLVDAGAPGAGDGDSGLARVLVALAAVVAVLLVTALGTGATILASKAVRRTRRRRGPGTRERVLGAWDEVIDRLAEAGIEPRASATATEFALRHAPARGAGDAGPPLMSLARLQTEALFAAAPPSEEAAGEAWVRAGEIETALARSATASTRWRRRLSTRRPRPRGQRPASRRWSTKAARSASKARVSASTSAA